MRITSELMPGGKANFLDVVKYPKISDLLAQHGEPKMILLLSIMVRDFCGSFNVQRNMNQDQILETAAMMLNECGNFRLEDYTIFFAMAKAQELGKIYERIDIQIISALLDAYYEKRKTAKYEAENTEAELLESVGPSYRISDDVNPLDDRLMRLSDGFAGALGSIKNDLNIPDNGQY